ncbi:MAG TPA: hypothetical protein VFQ02_11190, partial [Nitrospira sp.]|nr:hypothetical protein [Nitrospira sp.]
MPPKTAAETSMQKKSKRREREGLVVVLRAMLTSWLTKPTADSQAPSREPGDAAGDRVTIPQKGRATNSVGFGFLPKTDAADLILAALADVEV